MTIAEKGKGLNFCSSLTAIFLIVLLTIILTIFITSVVQTKIRLVDFLRKYNIPKEY